MNCRNKIYPLLLAAAAGVGFTACNDWLEVKMEDKIMEKTLYSKYSGYMSALNGIYLTMNQLYASGQSVLNISDVMAQYYNVTENPEHSYRLFMGYKYNELSVESRNTSLWQQTYTLLANNNAILDHLKTLEETPLTQDQFNILRGEVLGLRAFLHFDLVRRHGSVYSVAPDAECIPYQIDSKREVQPFKTHAEIMEMIIADLNEAADLLKKSDPIITDGVRNVVTEDNGVSLYDMSFRQLRMNYYAVQGLLARAYMWMGEKEKAYQIAKHEIIDKITTDDLTVFPWTTREQVEADKRPDHIFSSEVMFALYNSKRSDYNNACFSQSLQPTGRLTFYGETMGDSKVALLYEHDNDLRRKAWELVPPTQAEIDAAAERGEDPRSSLFFKKFLDWESGYTLSGADTYRYMIPLMRISEIYLIAAEATSDVEEAYKYINLIRSKRMCPDIPALNKDMDVMYEFAREVVGEGQLFYFYKRRNAQVMISRTGTYDYMMNPDSYVWPIPESEWNKRD